MKFHDQLAYNDIFNEAYPPTKDNQFWYLLGKLDGSMEVTTKLESIPTRGRVVQVMK
jgi:hypothetical protein